MLEKAISTLGSLAAGSLPLGIIVLDTDYRIILWNEWMEKHSDIKTKDILEQNIFDRFPDIRERGKDRYIISCIEGRKPVLLSPLLHQHLIPLNIVKGNAMIPMTQNVKIYPLLEDGEGLGAIIIIEDLTEQILHEKEIANLNRVLRGIRNVNQLITRVKSEEELFDGACEILVEDIGYALVWIGLIEEGSFDVKTAGFAGIDPQLFEGLKVTWDDSEYGSGATGRAVRTGEVQVIDSIQEDPLLRPWQDFTEKIGCQSTCSLPLKVDGRVVGAINVHSGERAVFYGEELRLLEEVTGDISFAIANLGERRNRRLAEEALAIEKERLAVTLRSIGDGMIATDTKGSVLLINAVAEDLTGWTQEEAKGKPLTQIFHIINEHTRKSCENSVKRVLATGMVVGLANHRILIARDGKEFAIGDSSAPIRDKEGKMIGVVLVFRDMTEKIKLEADLRQSQKMESIGTMAGGIAHEFNNILGTIIGNTELAINDVPESNLARKYLEEIQTASLRAKGVVSQLLGFARKSVFQLMPVQISPIISEALKLIRASIPTTIEIRRNISCKSDTLMADSTQISQVLMNLCTNAKNAMQEDGGVLEVKLEDTSLNETSATLYEDLSPGNYVKLTVKDNGHGIDPKNIDRIFDPYFTTSNLAEGTGMGLAVVHGIVKNHNGAITVVSEPGKGAVFEVLLPLIEAEAEQESGESKAFPTGNEKILFVDDEASLVQMAKRMLEIHGYQVEAKSDPVEVLELFRSKPDQFDLIITDMTMPKMTGDKLAKEILNIRPDMPIILCSGFSEKIDAEKARALGIRKYIEKPLDMSDFVVDVRKVLDAGRSEA